MKEITTLTIRQDWDEPRLRMRIYRGDSHFYIRVESDHPTIPPSMPMQITQTNFRDAKRQAERLLHLIRGLFRQVAGKSPDLPEHGKEMDVEIPAFLEFCLTRIFSDKTDVRRSGSRWTFLARQESAGRELKFHETVIWRTFVVDGSHMDLAEGILIVAGRGL